MRIDDMQPAIDAALSAGLSLFDTARAYPDNERSLAGALRAGGGAALARIVTKGGMTRPGGAWVPDGRAKAIAADCEASLTALDGLPIATYLLHAPDPRTPWQTSVRALARLQDRGLVAQVGLSNVNRTQLDEACAIAPISAVEVPLSWADDTALRGGLVERCEELGVTVIAHSPLGGPRRATRMERDVALGELAAEHAATPAEVALAWLLGLSPAIVAIPGSRRPETVRSAVRAASIALTDEERARVGRRTQQQTVAHGGDGAREVVVVMGIPGAGKSRIAAEYSGRGYVRLNRDERGGTLRELATSLGSGLEAGEITRAVLDNTYLSRASRSYVLEACAAHAVPVRCVWLDTPLDQAQVNLVLRLLDHFGRLPSAEEIKAAARAQPGLMLPTSQMRAVRELEPPSVDEGFAAVDRVAFSRRLAARSRHAGVLIAASAFEDDGWEATLLACDGPVLVFDWRPDGAASDLRELVERASSAGGRSVEAAVCSHGGGPPACWCRPPLPGLPLAFAHAHGLDLSRSALIGTSTAHRTLARVVGCRFVQPGENAGSP